MPVCDTLGNFLQFLLQIPARQAGKYSLQILSIVRGRDKDQLVVKSKQVIFLKLDCRILCISTAANKPSELGEDWGREVKIVFLLCDPLEVQRFTICWLS